LFAEYTGTQRPLEVDWSLERGVRTTVNVHRTVVEPITVADVPRVDAPPPEPIRPQANPASAFSTFWEFAVALNRSDPGALALAVNGDTSTIPLDAMELRRLLGMMWFRNVFPRLPRAWRDRLLNVLVEGAPVPDHIVKRGRHTAHLRELSFEELEETASKMVLPDWLRPDLDLLITIGRFWGADAVKRVRFVEAPERREPSVMESLLHKLRD